MDLQRENKLLTEENTRLNNKVSSIVYLTRLKLSEATMALCRKMEENQAMTKRLEKLQAQHAVFLTKLMLQLEQPRRNGQGLASMGMNDLIRTQLDTNLNQMGNKSS